MGLEIERKFLVNEAALPALGEGVPFRQGYLSVDPDRVVRVRLAGSKGWLTVKGRKAGTAAPEYEYPIPGNDAGELLERLCLKPLIEKVRYRLEYQGFLWEVDRFLGDNQGLVLAEIELPAPDTEFPRPVWLREEVTTDPKYQNAFLSIHPFNRW